MRVLLAISDSFPYGAAYAARTRALCKLIQSSGYRTDVLCDYPSKEDKISEYGNVYYVSKEPYVGAQKLFKLPRDYQVKLDSILNDNNYDLIVSRSMFDRFDRVLKTVRKHGIPLILESCEWYDVKGFARGKYDIRYWQFLHCFRKTYNRVDGVIAISRLLEEHYLSVVPNTIRIPAIHELEKLPYRISSRGDEEIRLIFAGNIFGGKEQFEELLIALSRANLHSKKLCLNIYGPTEQILISSLSEDGLKAYELIKNNIVIHGMVPQLEIANACQENDFGIFFRPNRRSSDAGFPTKLGEYLGAGTPVITNCTGDLALVMKDGINGYLLEKLSIEALIKIIEKITCLNTLEQEMMRKASRDSACDLLDYHAYTETFSAFAEVIIKQRCKNG